MPGCHDFSRVRAAVGGLVALVVLSLAGCDRPAAEAPPAADAAAPVAERAEPGVPARQPAQPSAALPYVPPKPAEEVLRQRPMLVEMKVTEAHLAAREAADDASKVANLGALYYVHGFPAEAADCFVRVTELQPEMMRAWYYLGLAREATGDTGGALRAYERALACQEDYAPVQMRLAGLLLERDAQRAAELYRRVIERYPAEARGHYGLGRALGMQGRVDEAAASLRKAFGLVPRYADAQRALAELLEGQGRSAEARVHRDLAAAGGEPPEMLDTELLSLRRVGADPEQYCADAIGLAGQRQFEQAEFVLGQARQLRADEALLCSATGAVLALQGRLDEAVEEFRRALEVKPDFRGGKSNLAQALGDRGDVAEAERLFREVLAADPEDSLSLQRFAALMARVGRPGEPVALVEAALAADPENAVLQFELGRVLLALGRSDEAIPHLRAALERKPDLHLARHALGVALHKQGDMEGARTAWKGVLETNPKFEEACISLVVLARQQGDSVELERVLRQGTQHLPNSPILANSLGWLLATSPNAEQRDGQEAVQMALRACTLTNNSNHAYVDTLAAALAEAGRFEEAVRAARRAIDMAFKAGEMDAATSYRARMLLYQENEPYRE